MLELYYNFSTNFRDVIKVQVLEMDTDSLYLDHRERDMGDCIGPELKADWKQFRSKGCSDSLTADTARTSFL